MHPKAALLALHGFNCYTHRLMREPRVKRGGLDNENCLRHHDGRWGLAPASELSNYKEIPWLAVQDWVWDDLTDAMVRVFLQTH